MINHVLKRALRLSIVILTAYTASGACNRVIAQNPDKTTADKAVDKYDMDIEQNLASPKIPRKSVERVANSAKSLDAQFKKAGFSSGVIRDGQVVMVSIPCHKLFAPNDDKLSDEGRKAIYYFKGVAETPELYKILVAVHTDDSGDEQYSYEISEARANEIDSFLSGAINGQANVVPYGMGQDQPLKDNHSREHRRANRRVEFYLVPEHGWSR